MFKDFEGNKEDNMSKQSPPLVQNKQTDSQKSRKRKNTILIKGQGKSRVSKKKKKKR